VLPEEKRLAICAMYAFMRYCDDISDGDVAGFTKEDGLRQWRSALHATMTGDYSGSPILPAFHDTVQRFGIPAEYFDELIDGAEMDLSVNRYATFDELYQYCYKVASVVGLVCIHIFGFRDDGAKLYAEHLGIAFQLTNILRDIKEDAGRGRIYIPLEDLARVGYSEGEFLKPKLDDRFRDLMRQQVDRAKSYYEMGAPLIDLIDPKSRGGLMAMIGIYSAILRKIEERDFDVLSARVRLSAKEKLGIAARALLCAR